MCCKEEIWQSERFMQKIREKPVGVKIRENVSLHFQSQRPTYWFSVLSKVNLQCNDTLHTFRL
jgi:hypothetical protein